jgi:hypothetical protein
LVALQSAADYAKGKLTSKKPGGVLSAQPYYKNLYIPLFLPDFITQGVVIAECNGLTQRKLECHETIGVVHNEIAKNN